MTHLEVTELMRNSEQIQQFVLDIERLYKFDRPGGVSEEKRENDRLPITMPVRIFPLTDGMDLRNFECRGVTRDISTTGVGLVTADPISSGFLKLELQPFQREPFAMIVQVVFSNVRGFYYHVGCEFVGESRSDSVGFDQET